MRKVRKPPVGARPGTLAFDPGAAKTVTRVFSYDEQAIEEHEGVDAKGIAKLITPGRKLWVDVQGLGDESLLRELAEIFSIPYVSV